MKGIHEIYERYLSSAVAPAINIVPRNLVVGRGRKVILECHVVGSPMPAIFWSKETKEDEEEEDDDKASFFLSDVIIIIIIVVVVVIVIIVVIIIIIIIFIMLL